MLVLIVFIALCVILIGLAFNHRNDEPDARHSPYRSNSSSNSNASRDPKYADKYIFGSPVTNDKELKQWDVFKGVADAMVGTLSSYERDIENSASLDDAKAAYEQWFALHDSYQYLVNLHRLKLERHPQNPYFIEQAFEARVPEFTDLNDIRHEILQYVKDNGTGYRSVLIKDISSNDPARQKLVKKAFCHLRDEKLIGEGKVNDRYTYEYRKPQPRQAKPSKTIVLAPLPKPLRFNFDPDYRTICKAVFGIGSPITIDKENGTGVFASLSRSDTYYTSLAECTCPAYQFNKNSACKHMLRLAMELELFDRPLDIWERRTTTLRTSSKTTAQSSTSSSAEDDDLETEEHDGKSTSNTQRNDDATHDKSRNTSSNKVESMSISELIDRLIEQKIKYVDKRYAGGCLWIVSTDTSDRLLSSITIKGSRIARANSCKALNGAAGWYITGK